MRQPFAQQQIESQWRDKASAALSKHDEEGYRSAIVNLRVLQVLGVARAQQWSSWKSRSVCKYIQKTFENMTIVELTLVNDQGIEELIDHAGTGFDRHARRAGK